MVARKEPGLRLSQWTPRIVAYAVTAIVGLDVIGWITASPRLVTMIRGGPAMMPMTALGLLALAIAVLVEDAIRREVIAAPRLVARLPVAVALGIAVWTLASYALDLGPGPEQWLFPRSLAALVPDPSAGRPSPQTAVSFILVGLALLGVCSPHRRRSLVARGLAALAGIEVIVVLSGLIYGEQWLYGISLLIGMAMHTAIAIGLLTIGVFGLAPKGALIHRVQSETTGGLFLRITLPLAVLLPFLAGLSVRVGERFELWGVALSQSLYQTLLVILLISVSILTERLISQSEARRVSLVAEQTSRANEAARRREIERALIVRERFINLTSHELKTPLTALFLTFALHRRLLAKLDPDAPDLARSGASLGHQIGLLRRLMANILDVQKLWNQAPPPRRREVDLTKLARKVVAQLRDEWREPIEIELDLAESVVGIWDEAQLTHMLDNLLTNALTHGEGADVSLALTTRDDRAALRVSDRGPGIAPEILPKLFESFDRADPNTPHGLGLGLYVVKAVVERHGGRIQVTDRDPGTTFDVSLPLDPPTDEPAYSPRE